MAKGVKTGGRTAGTVNKTTTEIREHFQNLVSDSLVQLKEDLNSLEPLQRLKMIMELSKFIVPTLKATELTETNDKAIEIKIGYGIDCSKLSTETLKELEKAYQ